MRQSFLVLPLLSVGRRNGSGIGVARSLLLRGMDFIGLAITADCNIAVRIRLIDSYMLILQRVQGILF